MPTQTFTASDTWVCPEGVTSVDVECWGGGGAGGGVSAGFLATDEAGGGAGGAYAFKTLSVIPGISYTVTVAGVTTSTSTSSAAQNTGGSSWFKSNDVSGVVAVGGPGGTPEGAAGTGTTTGCVGTVIYAGGNGANAPSNGNGGGGGGGAGSGGAGGNASGTTGGTGTTEGGSGGNGGGTGATPGNGNAVGGGGAGASAWSSSKAGGSGARGQVRLTWTHVRLPSDTETLSESVTRALTDVNTYTDTVTLSDNRQVALTDVNAASDTLSLADSVHLDVTRGVFPRDTMSLSDTRSQVHDHVRHYTSGRMYDNITWNRTYVYDDGLDLVDSGITQQADWGRNLSDQALSGDTVDKVSDRTLDFTDVTSLRDFVPAVGYLHEISVTATLTLSDRTSIVPRPISVNVRTVTTVRMGSA